jgi:hypothetical protein
MATALCLQRSAQTGPLNNANPLQLEQFKKVLVYNPFVKPLLRQCCDIKQWTWQIFVAQI